MNIVLYNTDSYERERLERMITGIVINHRYSSDIVLSSNNQYSVIEYAKNAEVISLYFLDIDYKGFDIAEEIRRNDEISPIVLMTGGSADPAVTYEHKVKAFDLIEKSNYDSCRKKTECSIISAEKRQQYGYANCIGIQCGSSEFTIPYDNIYFIETITGSHRLLLHTETHSYKFYGNIKDVLLRLDERFCQCHKSIIVNGDKIIGTDKQKRDLILLSGNTCSYSSKMFQRYDLSTLDKNK